MSAVRDQVGLPSYKLQAIQFLGLLHSWFATIQFFDAIFESNISFDAIFESNISCSERNFMVRAAGAISAGAIVKFGHGKLKGPGIK
ncbi:hypothetical protein U1Q18_032148, partial [Sarracenia purpurea var. burkii]